MLCSGTGPREEKRREKTRTEEKREHNAHERKEQDAENVKGAEREEQVRSLRSWEEMNTLGVELKISRNNVARFYGTARNGQTVRTYKSKRLPVC